MPLLYSIKITNKCFPNTLYVKIGHFISQYVSTYKSAYNKGNAQLSINQRCGIR